jgi:hypothetical protein
MDIDVKRLSDELLEIRMRYTGEETQHFLLAKVTPRYHVQTGTYKEEFEGGNGWAVERIVMPKSLGGVWLKLTPDRQSGVTVSLEPAV